MRERTITVSYIPLLYSQWHWSEISTKRQRRIVAKQIQEFVSNGCKYGRAKACLWTWETEKSVPTKLQPVLVLDRGSDIYNHMLWWSQNKLGEFFQFGLHYDQAGWYSCAILPNFTKSAARMSFNTTEMGMGKIGKQTLIFCPLSFYGRSPKATLDLYVQQGGTLPKDGGKISVGVLDSALVNLQATKGDTVYNPDDVNWMDIAITGAADEYLASLHLHTNTKTSSDRNLKGGNKKAVK